MSVVDKLSQMEEEKKKLEDKQQQAKKMYRMAVYILLTSRKVL